jgi:hypothetical protein
VFEKGNQKKCSDNWNSEVDGSKIKSKHTEKLNTNSDQNNEKFRIALILALSKKRRLKAPIAGSNIRKDNKKDKKDPQEKRKYQKSPKKNQKDP